MMKITRVGAITTGWGESTVWDERRQRLWFADCAAQTLHWLEEAARSKCMYLLRVTGDPRFDWLVPSRRFQAILHQMGLPVPG